MSKCQMNKYRAGGRCGGDSAGFQQKAGVTNASLASLISAREAQDASLFAAARPENTQIVVKPKGPNDKKTCIDIIMSYDQEE